ncbi:MAG: hypothetical protein H7A33_05545 [Deltaproteobacteria bacterium]|nr:hypothetical protein [Deltaproteobacteria bacterium]
MTQFERMKTKQAFFIGFFGVLAAIILCFTTTSGIAKESQLIKDPKMGFQIQFPDEPVAKEKETSDYKIKSLELRHKKILYKLVLSVTNTAVPTEEIESYFSDSKKAFTTSLNAQVTSESDIKTSSLGSFQDYTFETKDKLIMKTRLILNKEKMATLYVIRKGKSPDETEVTQFFDSFNWSEKQSSTEKTESDASENTNAETSTQNPIE